MSPDVWSILFLTLTTSALSTFCLIPVGLPLAWLLARYRWPGKTFLETLILLPLVIPPVATGLLLLKLFGRKSFLGQFFEQYLNLPILFTWRAVVIACSVMALPLFVRTARVAFEEINPRFEQVARTLGASTSRIFFTIHLPLAARGIISGAILAFARALGEFGATILVAGYIPGETSTLSLSIYHLVQLGKDTAALHLVFISILLAFFLLWFNELFFSKKT
jgi:molybdate transport system permease protein